MMVDAAVRPRGIQRFYDLVSPVYGLFGLLERRARQRGLELADVTNGERVLEVAPGVGEVFVELMRRVGPEGAVLGVELSRRMLRRTMNRVRRAGPHNFGLHMAHALRLPFRDGSFDVVYNSYMMDLVPLADQPVVLGEFRRVLREGGRLVVVSMTKTSQSVTLYERMYRRAPYLFGGCRPVLMQEPIEAAGFRDLTRQTISLPLPSEVIVARR
jgi:demethylmenaquinone methyltransferase/2-methoxy-6-polyprenyl-1,4-benzoquinol methylase